MSLRLYPTCIALAAAWAVGSAELASVSLGNETAGVAWEAAPELAGAGDNLEIAEGGRKMIVAAYGAAQFDIVALNIDVPRVRVLYLLLELPSPAQITVFYRTRGRADFGDDRTALATPPTFHAGPHAYRLDMGSMPGWTEEIEGLRVRLEGLMAGATVGFGGVVGTTGPLEELPGQESAWPVAAVAAQTPYRGERFAACSRTVVSIDEVTAAVGLSTYIKNPQESNPFGLNFDPQSQFGLARVAAGVVAGDRELTDRDAGAVRVSPQPGTLLAQLDFAGEQVHVQVTPLRPLSDTDRAEGAMLYRIRSSSGAPLWVTCGQMAPMTVWERGLWLRTGKPPHEAGTATIHESLGLLTHSDIPAVVVFRPGPGATELRVCDGGASGYVRFERGEGWLVVAFAADRARALELARIEPLAAEQASLAYFDEVFSHFRIKTPEPLLDEAFRTAWLTMDYSWVQPYGCTESLHHWWAIWQQYPSASFDWAGLACRTRESILSHAQRQYKSGNIPYLLYFGERHSDFGGNNQTFMWQVQHYLRSTGDAALAREILPEMRRLVDAFWRYEDLDGNRVPGFGVQVLTQEDYVATPRDGTSSAVVGVEMWRTLALVEQMSGNGERAIACQSRAREAAAGWRERLWQRELGRPAYFIDGLDQVRPDGQYHTLVLPVVYDLLNPLDAYTSIRHMTDRLVGPQGELYYSNNFPNHIGGARSSPFSPTWGMQAGAYMQPWAAWAYNRIGARNEAVRSLAVVARWATMFPHQDAWPESSTELTPAYFSNTAASYAQAVIEAVFGLQQDHSVSTLRVQPAFPDAWEAAEIDLAPLQAKYERHGDSFRYTIHTATPLRRCMRWPLPVCRVEKVEVNGIPCTFTTEQAVGGIWLMVTTEALEDTDIVFTMTPVAWSVAHAGSLAEGETMQATAAGCRIVGVDDPLQLVAETSWQEHGVELRLTDNRLAPWLRFGRLGQLNFARRTVFLRCEAAGQAFWAPVNFSLLPPYEAAPATDLVPADGGYDLSVTLRNNTSRLLAGTGTAFWAGGEAPLQISVAPRSDATLRVRTARHHLAQLAPGDNPLRLVLPTGSELQLACPVTGLFENLTDGIEAAVHPIPFLDGQLMTDEGWREFAAFPVFWQGPYNELPRPMDAIRGQKSVSCAALPGIAFPIADGGRIAVASRRLTRPAVVVDVGQTFRKVYLLVLSFAENHDAFTQCARVTVTCKADFERSPFDATDEPVQWTRARYDRLVVRRGLCTPGDLDSWMPEPHVGPLATARLERPDRYGLLTLLGPHNADWPEGVPLAGPYGLFAMLEPPPRDRWPEGTFRSFPQPQFWASCPTMRTASATFNIVEVDLLRPRHVLSIEVACPLQDSAVALVSAVGLEGASIPPSAEQ